MLALFIALGGTSYAAVNLTSNSVNKAHLRTNSVGKSEIRARAVGRSEVGSNTIGASELRTAAVGSNDVRDESLALADLAPAARTSLADLNGVTFRASGTGGGTLTAGNVRSLARTTDPGVYTVETGRDVSACQYSADVAGVKNGTAIEAPPAGIATAEPSATNTQVVVKTYDAAGTAINAPFSVLIAC
jgi:hypothetical protein